MANDKYSDHELKKKYGLRKGGTALFHPQELGYRCPKGHANIYWSEFKEHIWCYTCQKDYHYADDCVLVKDKYNPKDLPKQPLIVKGIKNWTKDGNGWNNAPMQLIEKARKEKK